MESILFCLIIEFILKLPVKLSFLKEIRDNLDQIFIYFIKIQIRVKAQKIFLVWESGQEPHSTNGMVR